MKNKSIKIVLFLLMIILIIFGISNLVKNVVSAAEGNTSSSSSDIEPGKLMEGQVIPTNYGSNIGSYIWDDGYVANVNYHSGDDATQYIPIWKGYDGVYCIASTTHTTYGYAITWDELNEALSKYPNNPPSSIEGHSLKGDWRIFDEELIAPESCEHADIPNVQVLKDRDLYYSGVGRTKYCYVTPDKFVAKYTAFLPPAMAYVVSYNDGSGAEWTAEKQKAIWQLKNVGKDGGVVIDGSKGGDADLKLTADAVNYSEYHEQVEESQGLAKKDLTDLNSLVVKVDRGSKKYTVGPYAADYVEAIYDDLAFGGISGITVKGYNKDKKYIKDVPIDSILVNNKKIELNYFKPDAANKVDKASNQKYPKPGQKFEVVFSDPNSGVDVNNPNRIAYVTVKIKFQYMLAFGEYTYYDAQKGILRYMHTDYTSSTFPKHEEATGAHYGETSRVGMSCGEAGCKGPENHGSSFMGHYKWVCTHSNSGKNGNPRCGYSWCFYVNNYAAQEIHQDQPMIMAKAQRFIYEQELELGKDGADITLDLGGKVWEDVPAQKESKVDGVFGGADKPVPGIPVLLYEKNGTFVEEKTTGSDGKYIFEKIDAMKQYYVEFKYNGQKYQNTIWTNKLDGQHSLATETSSDRDAFNKKLNPDAGNKYTKGEWDNMKNSYYIKGHALSTISAYTGSNGKDSLKYYPEVSKFVTKDANVSGYKYIYKKGDSVKNVDFGMTERAEFDMALKKDVYIATVKINGKTEVYGYDKKQVGNNDGTAGDTWTIATVDGGYQRGVAGSDWDFDGENGNHQYLEVYVTYKIAVRNQSMSLLGKAKITDYFDSTFKYMDNLSWISKNNYSTSKSKLDELQNQMENEKITEGTTPGAKQNGQQVTIDIGKKQTSGETQYVYLTFKVEGGSKGRPTEGVKNNKVEISEVETYYSDKTILPFYNGTANFQANSGMAAGRIDRDSIPSTMKATGSPQEDDEDNAPGINIKKEGTGRTISGSVWEDIRNKNVNGAIIGDGQKDNINVEGISVELIEKTVQGAEYAEYRWGTATTKNDGTYDFGGIIPGDYIVRFKYGTEKYNGQDYKSTIYQAGVTQNEFTDLDQQYKGYTDPLTQNSAYSYGYDIEAADGKNVSDAKDIWSDRERVNGICGGNTNNATAQQLAYPNGEMLKQLTMTAETGVIVMEVERNVQSTEGTGNPNYGISAVDLGLVERPKSQLEIDKSISNIKVLLANNTVLFDTNKSTTDVIWKDHIGYMLDKKKENGMYPISKYGTTYRKIDATKLGADKGLVQLTMDEEIMHGSTIEIKYNVTVRNVGEVDYQGIEYYYLGTNPGSKVTTSSVMVVDYVSNNLKFDAKKNDGWSIMPASELIKADSMLIDKNISEQVKKFNTILITDSLKKDLLPEESISKTLVLTQLITPENTKDDLTYNNIVEILLYNNSVGRRMAFSIVGNQDPLATNASEVDASMAENVIILPPFGDTHIYYILGAVIGIILIGGIAFIIKKVLKK